jgi:transposase
MAYGMELRTRVIKFVQRGGGQSEAARLFDVSLSAVKAWLKMGLDATPLKPGRKKGQGDKLDREALKAVLARQPDLMLKELAAMFGVSKNAVFHACKTADLPRKKNHHLSGSKVLRKEKTALSQRAVQGHR